MSLLDKASLIITPNSYKESKLYSVVPNTTLGDMDVVRATTATRVNSAGLIEVVPRNLLQRSEEFENAVWLAGGSGVFVVTTNSTTAPNGTLTADKLIAPLTNQTIRQNLATINTSFTLSVYLKTNSGTKQMRLFINDTQIESTVNVTSDWQRFTLSGTTGGSLFGSGRVGIANVDILNESSFVYIWGIQLDLGTTATEYFPTTTRLNIPRIDYTNGSCPSLLVEPQRTNLYTYSQQLNQWSKSGVITVTENDEISPEGTQNADRAQFTLSTDLLFRSGTGLAGSNTLTVYAKAKSGTSQKFRFFGLGGGTFSSDQVATNQWQRFTFTYTSAATNTAGLSGASTGASDVLFYGFQHEIGAYPTSYIPTVASTVTRNADVISKTGISSLIGQTEGTLFTDFVCNGFQNYGTPLSVNNSSTSNNIWITTFANGNIRAELYNGAVQASITYTGGVIGQRYKLAFAYKTNDFAMYVNGSLVGTDVSGTTFSGTTLSRLDFDLGNSALYSLSLIKVNQVILFPNRLTNSELAQLTTI